MKPFYTSMIFIVLAHWNNSPRIDMSLHLDILYRFRIKQSLTSSLIFRVLFHWNNSSPIHVAPLGHIMFPSKTAFDLTPQYCCVPSWESSNINSIVFGLTRPVLEQRSTTFGASTVSIIPHECNLSGYNSKLNIY